MLCTQIPNFKRERANDRNLVDDSSLKFSDSIEIKRKRNLDFDLNILLVNDMFRVIFHPSKLIMIT